MSLRLYCRFNEGVKVTQDGRSVDVIVRGIAYGSEGAEIRLDLQDEQCTQGLSFCEDRVMI
jgi:hypothetical protein|tara:strand:+ start:8210 stop:8392 length:183 start_codon:yes stop_codon:yes gene_type:complete